MFKERWRDSLKEYKRFQVGYETKETYQRQLWEHVNHCIDITAEMLDKNKTTEEIKDILTDPNNNHPRGRGFSRMVHKSSSDYSSLLNRYEKLINERKQDAYADLVERFRYLLFRILTAVGIAIVILGTGYLAHKWGIPLPFLRFPI